MVVANAPQSTEATSNQPICNWDSVRRLKSHCESIRVKWQRGVHSDLVIPHSGNPLTELTLIVGG